MRDRTYSITCDFRNGHFLTVIHHLISNSSSSNPIKMSSSMIAPSACYATYRSEHASLRHRITFDYSLSSPVPTHRGRTLGYSDDSTTHTLLGLEEDDQVMHSGTYSLKEPGAEPVALSLLRDGSFDQRPFMSLTGSPTLRRPSSRPSRRTSIGHSRKPLTSAVE